MTSNMPFPGIVGLGTNDMSLVVQKRYPSFSYCTISDFRGDVEGWIHFGSESQLFGRSTPLLTSPANDFYRLSFQGISVDGEDLKLPKKEALKSAMPDENVWSINPWELCFKNIDNDPEINFNFEDLSFPLRLINTWLRVSDVYCLAITRTTDFSVFGMFQQRGVNVGYDLENKQLRLKYVDYCPDDDDEYN
ncbi:hypothetical protein Vadar_034580 [Vaccinium darrowii]|uniref:Uncharacterized protein n=1 Tax=Vaccinium darrowii TaxID=229202 RepID=A0ACB7YSV0_9ERIC|nr:hypothetical protein Vadar_034580 [Vaccinium darrowii]